ncbi:MAG: ATP-binding protein [Desulfococcaceae bacterium]
MKELVVISGKGGTGKTSIVSAFSHLANNAVFCDADVDAADLHLILSPRYRERHPFQAGRQARIDADACVQCGDCRDRCRFGAVTEDFRIDPVACEGCGVCAHFCPEGAVRMEPNLCGEWFVSDTRFGPLVHARLGIAEENSGKLVARVRTRARELAETENRPLLLTDGPPGVGCPVIAAVGGADAVLIVTEPTVSGRHDMARVAELAAFFSVPALLLVNKYDLNPETGEEMEAFAREKGIRPIGRLPFDPAFTRAMLAGKTLFEYGQAPWMEEKLRKTWRTVMDWVEAP